MKKPSLLAGTVVIGLLCAFASIALAAGTTAFSCNGTFSGGHYQGVVVPAGGTCTLSGATVSKSVQVAQNGYFEADSSKISGSVWGKQAQTVFINGGSVGGNISANRGAQLFAYNATVGGYIGSSWLTTEVEICGNTVAGTGIGVIGLHPGGPGNEILIGDPAAGCSGNTITNGSVAVAYNSTDVDFVMSGNTVRVGNLWVAHNVGTSEQLVQNNNGGNRLACSHNTGSPFTGSPNGHWASILGQCH